MNKADLRRGFDEYFNGYVLKYAITLDDSRTESKKICREFQFIPLERKVTEIFGWLREKVVGNKREHDMRGFCSYEIGKLNGVVHSHLVIGLKGETDRTHEWISDFVNRKWEKLRSGHKERNHKIILTTSQQKIRRLVDIARSDQIMPWEIARSANTDVTEIYDINGCFKYGSKDYLDNLQNHQFSAYSFL